MNDTSTAIYCFMVVYSIGNLGIFCALMYIDGTIRRYSRALCPLSNL